MRTRSLRARPHIAGMARRPFQGSLHISFASPHVRGVAPVLPLYIHQLRFSASLVDRGEGAQFSRHLVDKRRIHIRAGRGGNGACVYEKHKKHKMLGPGWPAGGSGGRGGDVYVRATGSHFSLAHIQGVVQADNGQPGRKRRVNGASGSDITVLVPRGVVIRELLPVGENTTGEREEAHTFQVGEVIADLDEVGASAMLARGGHGGRGNTMAIPHEAVPGMFGEERRVELELKTIADVGLVGMPNAGKSTLLGAVSRACPRIAPYPFTTVAPYVGVADFVDGSSLTIADVPGLVEGAHRGEGLGHEFLRHLERTKILLYVVDVARSQDPFADLLCLQREVYAFSREMAAKPCGVVANKCDLAPALTLPRVDELFHAVRGCDAAVDANSPLFVRATSVRFGEGVAGLLQELRLLLQGQHEGWLARMYTGVRGEELNN